MIKQAKKIIGITYIRYFGSVPNSIGIKVNKKNELKYSKKRNIVVTILSLAYFNR